MNHGLTQDTVEKIKSVLAQFPEVEAAILYGSRAKGNYKEWSDIDLALTGEIGLPKLFNITHLLDELSLPYFFDVTLLKDIQNLDLREHINRRGVPFYNRQRVPTNLV
ncbi:MAG: nucleotidyltransferase domain-containing protein [Cyclobacteriaceae bacterium]|jgi:predicted nucleotidyltransferase